MVETLRRRPNPIPDGQRSDAGTQKVLDNIPVARMNSEQRAAYLEQKFRQQQSFYQAAKIEDAHLPIKYDHPKTIDRQNDIMEKIFVFAQDPATIADEYGKDEVWVHTQLKFGLLRLRGRSPLEIQERYPEESIILSRSDLMKQREQKAEEDLVSQLERDDISSKEEVEELMGRVSYRFYGQHKDLFMKLDGLMEKQGFQVEGGYSAKIMQMVSDFLRKEGVVVKEMNPEKTRGGKPIHIIWFQDYDDVKDLVNGRIKSIVEATIS